MTSSGKVRIYELSRDLGLDNKDVLDAAERLSIAAKSHSSSISDDEAARIRSLIRGNGGSGARPAAGETRATSSPPAKAILAVKKAPSSQPRLPRPGRHPRQPSPRQRRLAPRPVPARPVPAPLMPLLGHRRLHHRPGPATAPGTRPSALRRFRFPRPSPRHPNPPQDPQHLPILHTPPGRNGPTRQRQLHLPGQRRLRLPGQPRPRLSPHPGLWRHPPDPPRHPPPARIAPLPRKRPSLRAVNPSGRSRLPSVQAAPAPPVPGSPHGPE